MSERLAARLANMQIGEAFTTGPVTLRVVGHFDGNRSAFDSEMWMDADEARSVFDRENYSSVCCARRTTPPRAVVAQLQNDKRFKLRALPEVDYYRSKLAP